MSERKLYQKFKDKMRKAEPNSWVYKIPDTFNLGGKKPGDFFCVAYGVPFLLEFKSEDGTVTKYQAFQQVDFVNAGGEGMIFWEGSETLDEFVNDVLRRAKEVRG